MSIEDRLAALEEQIITISEVQEVKECVFCRKYGDTNGYTGYLSYKFNSLFFADDLVKQSIFVETGT